MSRPADPLLLRHVLAALHGRECSGARMDALHRLTTISPDDLVPLMVWLTQSDHADLNNALRELVWTARCVVTGQQRLTDLPRRTREAVEHMPLWLLAELLDPDLEGR